MKTFIFLTGLALLATSCYTTRITSSWKEQGKTVQLDKLNKVLVVAMLQSETSRHKAEDQMAAYLRGAGVVSYNYLDSAFNKLNIEAIRAKIKGDGFDGAVTMRLIDVERERRYIQGNFAMFPYGYGNFGGFYYSTWPFYNSPGYYETTKIFKIEVNVFSIKEDKIIWSALTESTNPDGLTQITKDISKRVYNRMVKDKFVGKLCCR